MIIFFITTGYSEEMFELLVFAVKDLKKSLRDQGSDLMIRIGSAENVIQELVKEVVYSLLSLLFIVKELKELQALINSLCSRTGTG